MKKTRSNSEHFKVIAFAGSALIVLLGIFTIGISHLSDKQSLKAESQQSRVMFRTGTSEVAVNVEVADTPELIRTGLMFRTHLGADEGMLFVYPDSEVRTFWMKNTLIPLDMMFVSEAGEIVQIHQAEPCKSEPCLTYSSGKPAMYVIEVNRGFAEQNNLRIGDEVDIKAKWNTLTQ